MPNALYSSALSAPRLALYCGAAVLLVLASPLYAQTAERSAEAPSPATVERLRRLIGPGLDVLDDAAVAALAGVEAYARAEPADYLSKTDPCYAPGTDLAFVYAERTLREALREELGGEVDRGAFQFAGRWVYTATDGFIDGDAPTALTWSYVPDGTIVPGLEAGEDGPSELIAFLNDVAGPPTVPGDYTTAPWHALFVEAYGAWASRTGLTITYEPNDDGGVFPGTTVATVGQLGVRGDMRIGAQLFNDGPDRNVLAFNYFPSLGDMVLDVGDRDLWNFGYDGNGGFEDVLVNLITHEIGHGLGIAHVIPVNQTKLMEPSISFAYRGPQEDDILAGLVARRLDRFHDESEGLVG